jgi:hypothetical protein
MDGLFRRGDLFGLNLVIWLIWSILWICLNDEAHRGPARKPISAGVAC